MLSHGNLMVNALNALGEGLWPSSTVYLHAAPMFHLANGAAMYSVLLSGGSNVSSRALRPTASRRRCSAIASPTCCWCRP
jgi:long-chain acyl-CoA synthetase